LPWGCSTDSERGDRAGFDANAREIALPVALRRALVRGAANRFAAREPFFFRSQGDAVEPAMRAAARLLDLNSPIRNLIPE
jgi:hypothetical protein